MSPTQSSLATTSPYSIVAVDADEFVRTIHDAGARVPVEQSPEWARYDDSLPGRRHWRYLLVHDAAGAHVAALSLTEFAGRALVQLWGKFAPIWLTHAAPSAADERALRDALAAHLKEQGVPTAVYYPIPLHLQPAYEHYPRGAGGLDLAPAGVHAGQADRAQDHRHGQALAQQLRL